MNNIPKICPFGSVMDQAIDNFSIIRTVKGTTESVLIMYFGQGVRLVRGLMVSESNSGFVYEFTLMRPVNHQARSRKKNISKEVAETEHTLMVNE